MKTNFLEKFWYIFVILALVLVGVVAGLWIYNQQALNRQNQTSAPAQVVEETVPTIQPEASDAQTTALGSQSQSDEIASIEADLKSTDLSNLDQEMANIETEINNP